MDGFDNTGIWMINGYADASKQWGYAFGKVLGTPLADLDVLQAFVDRTTNANSPYRLALVVQNLGGAAAPATSGTLTLTRRGSPDIPVKTFDVPARGPGRHSKTLTIRFAVPAATAGAGYSLKIDLDSGQQVEEYDESNNTVFLPGP